MNSTQIEEDVEFNIENEKTTTAYTESNNTSKKKETKKKKRSLLGQSKPKTSDNTFLPKTAQDTVPYVNAFKNGIIESEMKMASLHFS